MITQSVGSRHFGYQDWADPGLRLMVREGLQDSGGEWFVAGASPRPEEFRVIYNASHEAGVVRA